MADLISCTTPKDLTIEQLLGALLTKTAEGDWALRTMEVTACAEDAIACDIPKGMDAFDMLKRIVGINECGKPAIRLAIGTPEA